MMANAVKHLLSRGQPVVGHWISLPCPAVTELIATFEPDWLMIDTEHGPAGGEMTEDLIRAMRGTATTPFVRVAANHPALIKHALDRGAMGVLVPMVSSSAEAQAAVTAARYPPDGIRGAAGTRANRYGSELPAYFAGWNREVLVAVQIETAEGLEHVETIAAVPGLDVLFIGPNDLSAALGCFQQFDRPEFTQAVTRILAAAQRHGLAAGYHTGTVEEALARIADGFRFVGLSSDARLLAASMGAVADRVRLGLRAWRPGPG
jgi:2-keto-3-deoxy-L-rhamnonate aldolase RhmA